MSAAFGADFGQKVDLTASIRNILRNYPEGTAVLKELVQNADDAGARTVSFCLDFRQHATVSVAGPELGQFQGPALLVFNDAVFTEEDFRSIQRIGDSLKKSSESKAKIGRFGIGFNAVYHWTDLPSFISSKYLVMLDPQARFLPNVNPSNPGKIVDWVTNPSLLTEFQDQFEPYRGHGGLHFTGQPFEGTIFRLPLRTPLQAESSMLSKRSLPDSDSRGLMLAMQREASAMLLFLKNIETIEIKLWEADSPESRLIFRCRIANLSGELRVKRAFVGNATKAAADATAAATIATGSAPTIAKATKPIASSTSKSHPAEVPNADYSLNVDCNSFVHETGSFENYEETWEVCNQLGGPSADAIASDPTNELLRLVPWGGVAAFVYSSETRPQDNVLREGLAYCFLPLPVKTNLPVMVNGFFELSSNRRDVWQAGSDMTGDGRTRAEWNLSIMRDVIAPSYLRLLLRLRDRLGFQGRYQGLWPSIDVPAPWNEVVSSMLNGCKRLRLLQMASTTAEDTLVVGSTTMRRESSVDVPAAAATAKAGLGWMSSMLKQATSSAIGVTGGSGGAAAVGGVGGGFSAEGSYSGWIEVVEAVLLPIGATSIVLDTEQEQTLAEVLMRLHQPYVACIPPLRRTLTDSKTCVKIATPQLLRSVLKISVKSPTPTKVQFLPPPSMCSFLQLYCFSDLKPESPSPELDGLQILPLCSNATGILRIFSVGEATAIKELHSMGFPLSKSVRALSTVNFDVMQACEQLALQSPSSEQHSEALPGSGIFVLATEEESRVFAGAAVMLIDKSKIGPREIQFLTHAAMQRMSNVRTFQAAIVPELLAELLPAKCLTGPVERAALSETPLHEYLVFLAEFWRFASMHADIIAAVAQGPALVSCLNESRFLPLASMSNLMVSTKGDLTLSPELQEILSIVGVNIVDPVVVADVGAMPKVFWEYVQGPSRSGILSTFASIMRNSSLASPAGATQLSASPASPFDRLSDEQREVLRLHLASCEPVKSMSPAEVAILRKLPLFTTFEDSAAEDAEAGNAGSEVGKEMVLSAVKRASSSRSYFSIDAGARDASVRKVGGKTLMTLVDCSRLDQCLFPQHFVKYLTSQELQLLQHVGVRPLKRTEYFRDEFLPKALALYSEYPNQTQNSLTVMITELNALQQEDSSFVNFLKSVPFIPAPNSVTAGAAALGGSGAAVGPVAVGDMGVNLYKPSELFDPHEVELVTLLDVTFFPIPTFQRDDVLVFLRSLGLQSSLDWHGVISCAESIAAIDHSVDVSESNRKIHRGKSLLQFLDKNVGRLLGESSKSSTGGSSSTSESSSSGFSLFSIRSLFGEKKTVNEPALKVDQYVAKLNKVAWMPIVMEPTHPCMPWYRDTLARGGAPVIPAVTAPPAQCRPFREAWHCSASLYLVRDPVNTESLRKLLGWAAPVDFDTLAMQLREISRKFLELRARSSVLLPSPPSSTGASLPPSLQPLPLPPPMEDSRPDSGSEIPSSAAVAAAAVDMSDVRETITGLIPQLYQRLNALADSHGPALLSLLDSAAWIWVGDTFVTPDKVAISTSVNASPYLFQLPQDLQVYNKLLGTFRVKSAFGPRDYIQVLRQMAEESGAVTNPIVAVAAAASASGTIKSGVATAKAVAVANPTGSGIGAQSTSAGKVTAVPLSDANIDLAVSLVTLLSSEGSVDAAVQAIYVPDNTGRLALSTDLINDDVPWMSGPEYAGVRAGCRLIHPNISSLVAERMGVKSLRLHLVNSTTNQTLFTVPEDSVEAFGQSESITNRLRTILDMYPDGNPIFSELIQNADDAGATVVRIMVDENTYSTESLMDSKMAPLQGPSLLVGNDAVFTEADFRSLARIGQGSKIEKLATTGRFGLGFSSTYHLTDTPTFVSGEHLVVFDPHCAFVPGASRNQPGLRIRFQGNAITTLFKDQFEPYSYFGCDFKSRYNGTLFRFPLRTTALARRSEISKRSYTVGDVQANLDQLIGQLSHHLLFLRSVRRIEIYHCTAGQRTPSLLHCSTARSFNMQATNDQTLLRYFDKDPSGAQPSRDNFYSKLMSTPDEKLPMLSHKLGICTESYAVEAVGDALQAVVVSESESGSRNGASEISTDVARVTEGAAGAAGAATVEGDGRSPATPSIIRLKRKEEVEYLVISGLRGGDAKRMACDSAMRHLKLVPLGAVAACVLKTVTEFGHSEDPVQGGPVTKSFPSILGQTFCFLPLPVQTQLPVHTNAYWELSSNRRDIWRGDDTKGEAKLRSEWNKHIMSDVLAPLYAQLLVRAAAMISTSSPTSTGAVKSAHGSQDMVWSPYDILRLLPCPMPAEPWNAIAQALFPLLRQERLLYSNLGSGAFLPLKAAYLLESISASTTAAIVTEGRAIMGGGVGVAIATSSMPSNQQQQQQQQQQSRSTDEDERLVRMRLESLLRDEVIPVALVPSVVLRTLLESGCVAGEVNPDLVRRHFTEGLQEAGRARRAHLAQPYPTISRGGALSDEQVLSNALFLLQYCFRDINRNSYTNLHELPLLPMEDSSLGTINSTTDPPLFLASDVERKLLARAGGSIVVSDAVLGPAVSSCIRDPNFALVCNVRPISPLDVLRLLRTFFHESWFATSTLIVNRAEIISDEWLISLWNYVLEGENLLALFGDIMPMLPIMQPVNQPKGAYVAKISPRVPILHMAFKDTPAAAAGALNDLGLYIFDPAVLSGISYNNEVAALLKPPSARGVLDSLSLISTEKIQERSSQWSTETKDALRVFVLDTLLAKVDGTNDTDKAILRSLPIWLCFGSPASPYCVISDDSQLPPRGIKVELLGPEYLQIRSERDRSLYQHLGMEIEPVKGKFYATYLVPRAVGGQLLPAQVDEIVVGLLRNLPQLGAEFADLGAVLKQSAIFRSASGQLCTPQELYDPQAPALAALLPKSSFPATFLQEPSLLLSLRSLGINSVINCVGVVNAAKSIQADFDTFLSSSSTSLIAGASVAGTHASARHDGSEADVLMASALKRSKELVKYLDLHIESMLEEADPDSLEQLHIGSAAGATVEGAVTPRRSFLAGGAWGQELRSLRWIACHTLPPVAVAEVAVLPWPTATHKFPVATPSQCVMVQDLWSCSASHRIASVEVKTEGVRALLGWNKTVSGRVAALQLLQIKDLFEDNTNSRLDSASTGGAGASGSSQSLVEAYYQVLPRIMNTLSAALDSESGAEVDVWLRALSGKACVWIGGRFVEPNRIAFKSPSNVNTEPFLFVLQGDMLKYAKLYRRLGVREAFEAGDLVELLRLLRGSYVESALPQQKLEVSLGILKLLVRMIKGQSEEDEPAAEPTIDGDDNSDAESADESGGGELPKKIKLIKSKRKAMRSGETGDDGDDDDIDEDDDGWHDPTALTKVASSQDSLLTPPLAISVQDLGDIYVPDREGKLCLATILTYDDAPWISSALIQRSGSGAASSSGTHFVHVGLLVDEAKILGVRSLREQMFAGDEIICPEPRAMSKVLGDDSLADTLSDLSALSDSLGAKGIHVVYDERLHPCESLMHPGLADAQGAAIIVFIDGPTVTSEEIAQLLNPTMSLPQLVKDDDSPSVSSKISGSVTSALHTSTDTKMYPRSGKQLTSVFAVTDCFQIISGREFFIFDPSGQYLLNADDTAAPTKSGGGGSGGSGGGGGPSKHEAVAGRRNHPKAQRCQLVGKRQMRPDQRQQQSQSQDTQDILTRFPDQFVSMASLPFGLMERFQTAGSFDGLLIRLPLRKMPSVVSATVLSLEEVKFSLRSFTSVVKNSLLVGMSHLSSSCTHWGEGDERLTQDMTVTLASHHSPRTDRWMMMNDKGWKRSAITSFFSKSFVPPELIYRASLDVRLGSLTPNDIHGEPLIDSTANAYSYGWIGWSRGEILSLTGRGNKSAVLLREATAATAGTAATSTAAGGSSSVVTPSAEDNVSGTEDWLIMSVLGAGKCKEEAVREPFRAMKMQPFVTVCCRVMNDSELEALAAPPDFGRIMCGGGALVATGLPFHIEGPFLQHATTRWLPLAPSKDAAPMRPDPTIRVSRPGVSAILSMLDMQSWNTSLVITAFELIVPRIMFELRSLMTSPVAFKGFYKYWPFLSRMSKEMQTVSLLARIESQLARSQYFLTSSGFENLDRVIMPLHDIPTHILTYLQAAMPVGVLPVQITRDLQQENIRPAGALTPQLLRDFLIKDASTQKGRLRNRFDLLIPLLRFCLSDLKLVEGIGEFDQRKRYRMMMGCPLLVMADCTVKTFPASKRERLFLVPHAVHALLPMLRDRFLHPALDAKVGMFKNLTFLNEVFISNASVALVEEVVMQCFPSHWRKCEAVDRWAPEVNLATAGAGRGLRTQGAVGGTSSSSRSAPSQLLIYTLWKEILSKEPAVSFDSLIDWPLIPVISRGRRILLSPDFLPHLLSFEPTTDEDAHRAHLQRETGRLGSLVANEANSQARDADLGAEGNWTQDWAWVTKRVTSRHQYVPVVRVASVGIDGRTASASASASASSVEDQNSGEEGSFLSPASDDEATVVSEPASGATLSGGLSAPSAALQAVVHKVGLPVIDGNLFDGPPLAAKLSPTASTTAVAASLGRKLLHCMALLISKNVIVNEHSEGESSDLISRGFILQFDALSVDDRLLLLEELFRSHRAEGFSAVELEKLKTLKLFTPEANPEDPVSISDCAGGAYWCASDNVLDGISLPEGSSLSFSGSGFRPASSGGSSTASTTTKSGGFLSSFQRAKPAVVVTSTSSSVAAATIATATAVVVATGVSLSVPPVILVNDPKLRELYSLLGVEELTAATAVRRFTLPALNQSNPDERLQIMTSLSRRWGSFREDAPLVQSLRDVAFIPRWNSCTEADIGGADDEDGTGDDIDDSIGPPRRPMELFSWTNEDLLSTLQGPVQSHYFAPPQLRTPEMQVMLTDLGMSAELNKESLLALASAIEATAVMDKGDGRMKQRAAERGRRFLRYIQEDVRSASLFDMNVAKKLSKIAIVPVQIPVGIDVGCHMHFRQDVVRFEQVVSSACGALVFTVLPVLDNDIAPAQMYFSWLGITVSPPLEVVLRHVRNLTSQGDLLDRWNNAQFTPRDTMSAIFQYLHEHWRDVSVNVKQALVSTPLIPVGHYLVPPSRLFFRLAEDLSPFMHEVPRFYGAHEAFLKQVGVKESPSASDYSQFLRDLALECRDCALNPNELRAVIAIVHSVASQKEEVTTDSTTGVGEDSTSGSGLASMQSTLYVPDENSVLRGVVNCLYNDDNWLRNRAGGAVEQAGFFYLHPSVGAAAASSLHVPPISSVLKERLQRPYSPAAESLGLKPSTGLRSAGAAPESMDGEPQLQVEVSGILTSSEFIQSVAAMVVHARSSLVVASTPAVDGVSSRSRGDPTTAGAGAAAVAGAQASAGTEGAEHITAQLTNLHLRFVKNLPTYLILLDTRRTPPRELDLFETESGAAAGDDSALSFVEDVRGKVTLYVNCSALTPPLTMEIAVSLGICKLLHLSSSLAASVACLMSSATMGKSAQILASLRVGSDPATVRERLRGLPGERVTATDLALLELKPFRVFRAGEIIVFDSATVGSRVAAGAGALVEEVGLSSAAAADAFHSTGIGTTATAAATTAKVTDVKSSSSSSSSDISGSAMRQMGADLRYGRVVTSGAGEEGGVRRVTIKTAASVVGCTLLSTDVYSFKTAREAGKLRSSPAATTSGGHSFTVSALRGVIGAGVSGAGSGASIKSKSLGPASSAPVVGGAAGAAGLSGGGESLDPIGRDEIMDAMAGLLVRAGIPVGMDTKDLMSRIVELGGTVKRLETELMHEKSQMVETKESLARLQTAAQCQICLINKVNQVLVPCGHVLCFTCVGQLQRNKCPFCRRAIQQKMRFFSPGEEDESEAGGSATV